MKNIVTSKWLSTSMHELDMVIVDCRFLMEQPNAGRNLYETSHIPGAVYLDLEKDLSAPEGEYEFKYGLPDIFDLTVALSRVGIGNNSRVVAYDDQGGVIASRLWWLLKYFGHEDVFVLDEGFTGWINEGYPVSAEQKDLVPTKFLATVQHTLLVEMDEVNERIGDDRVTFIDSREALSYLGEEKQLEHVVGHIPGAINYFWKDSFEESDAWKDVSGQIERFSDLSRDREIIVYGETGVTATPNFIALQEAGFSMVRLYAGSWSEWVSDSSNSVATGKE